MDRVNLENGGEPRYTYGILWNIWPIYGWYTKPDPGNDAASSAYVVIKAIATMSRDQTNDTPTIRVFLDHFIPSIDGKSLA